MIIYLDGVFDLFHRGHLESIKIAKHLGDYLIIGVISDVDSTQYKRSPIINEIDRCEILKNIKQVDEIIFPAPLVIDETFLKNNKIDLVVHGFNNKEDFEKQKPFFKTCIENNKFKEIIYYDKISTTDIIKKIVTTQNNK
jgi:cytidyltransferase-like protein